MFEDTKRVIRERK